MASPRAEGRAQNADQSDGLLRDDFASMREVVERRYGRLQRETKPLPSLILIDGGIGQLHAAAQALEKLEIINQPLASIAKKEEILYVLGREDEPIVLDRHSPVLHLIQQIRDETHRFAVTFHRQRRSSRRLRTSLADIPGVGERTAQKSSAPVRQPEAPAVAWALEELAAEIPRGQAQRMFEGCISHAGSGEKTHDKSKVSIHNYTFGGSLAVVSAMLVSNLEVDQMAETMLARK